MKRDVTFRIRSDGYVPWAFERGWRQDSQLVAPYASSDTRTALSTVTACVLRRQDIKLGDEWWAFLSFYHALESPPPYCCVKKSVRV